MIGKDENIIISKLQNKTVKVNIKKILLVIIFIILGLLVTANNKVYANECTVGDVTFVYNVSTDGKAENVYVKNPEVLDGKILTIPSTLDRLYCS